MSSAEQRPVKWSAASIEDLTTVWGYIAADASPAVADRQLESILAAVEKLRHWPNLGRDRSELREAVRSISVPPYLVFYRVLDFSIEVVRVLHGRRDLGVIFKNGP